MKKFILIIIAVIALGAIGWGVWFFAFSGGSHESTLSIPGMPLSSAPLATQSQTQSGTSARVQSISSPQNSEVAKDFLGGIQNADQIALGGTIVSSLYALQIWGDANKGGEALLEDTSSTGWTLLSLGGGEWTVLALVQEGVPISIAKQLVLGLTNGTAATSTAPSISIPGGDAISLGTAKGIVTMVNFYKNADYIDQDQQAVVIKQTSNYSIIYYISGSGFSVTISGTPFQAARQMAETAFLSLLNISTADACKLNVTENAAYPASDPNSNISFPLSFCGGASASSTFTQ